MLTIIVISYVLVTITSLPVTNNVQSLLNRIDPTLLGNVFEGDILLRRNIDRTRGAAINGESHRWPNKIIPYDITNITYENDRMTMIDAMNNLMYDIATPIPGQTARKLCVLFRPAQPDDQDIVTIRYGIDCSATIGHGPRYTSSVNLKPWGCFYSGIIQHELVHVLGFFHEQSRQDRDQYITIHYENIDPKQLYNFEKYQWGDIEFQGTSYDFGSLMHYKKDEFSINGQPTITSLQPGVVIGQRDKLSPIDIAEIRSYYNCS